METVFLTFLGGVLMGAAIMFLHARSVDRTNTNTWYVWYRNGYNDGYENGKRETEDNK